MAMSAACDRATGWSEVIPLRNITAQTVAQAFLSTWISRFGCPSQLTCDQGKQFKSERARNLFQYFNIKRSCTTVYHPQSNGLIERFLRTPKNSLSALLDIPNWVSHLPLVLLSL